MAFQRPTYDCVLIGGGVIGLSLAWELARKRMRVCVLERDEPGRGASWAGAGILPPGADALHAEPLQRLLAQSSRLHEAWAGRLREETSIDTGFRKCGAFYIACEPDELARLDEHAKTWSGLGVELRSLQQDVRDRLEGFLGASVPGGFFVPAEAQIRNPRHVQALLVAAARCGADVLANTPAEAVRVRGDRIEAIDTREGRIVGGEYCFTAGSWTSELVAQAGFRVEIRPIRGQIVLLRAAKPLFESVINAGLRYLVPRDDGRILIGSTMEDVGFDPRATARGVGDLLAFAIQSAPRLADCTVERAWAGLRPATADDLPILGRIPRLRNGWIASGHFRNGLALSTATAENVARLICGSEPSLDLAPFSPLRFAAMNSDHSRHSGRPLATRGV